jgi:hypothetical protein
MTASLTLTKPRKRFKNGTVATRTKGVYLNELDVTQYAFEKLNAVLDKLVAAHNANGKALKGAEIELQLHGQTLRKLRAREKARGE